MSQRKVNQKIKDAIGQDTGFNATPDQPLLRYYGDFKAFLWDEMKDSVNLVALGLQRDRDFQVVAHNARTVHKFLPIKNAAASTHKFMLPVSPEWPRQMKPEEIGSDFDRTPRAISGKLFRLSLAAIRALDKHYCNTILSHRLNVRISEGYSGQVKENTYLTWYQPLTANCKYDPHAGQYSFASTVSPTNMTTIMEFGEKHWCHQMYSSRVN